jgi:hypothetical protein
MRARVVALYSRSLLQMGGSFLLLVAYRIKMKGFIIHLSIQDESQKIHICTLKAILEKKIVVEICL